MTYFLVPTYKKVDDTLAFIKSVKSCVEELWHIVLVDDDPDLVTTRKCSRLEHVTVLAGTGGLFWGGSMNRAIQHLHDCKPADDDIVIFANADVMLDKSTYGRTTRKLPLSPHLFHPRTIDQRGRPLSSGARVITWLPYITKHPVYGHVRFAPVHLATARFLAMSYRTLCDVGAIRADLPQYHGDNEFSYRARQKGHRTYVVGDASCKVDEGQTGAKNNNIAGLAALWRSFFSIRSSASIIYRLRFLRACLPTVIAELVLVSLTVNSTAKAVLNRIGRRPA